MSLDVIIMMRVRGNIKRVHGILLGMEQDPSAITVILTVLPCVRAIALLMVIPFFSLGKR